jgi:hypothetical protein
LDIVVPDDTPLGDIGRTVFKYAYVVVAYSGTEATLNFGLEMPFAYSSS